MGGTVGSCILKFWLEDIFFKGFFLKCWQSRQTAKKSCDTNTVTWPLSQVQPLEATCPTQPQASHSGARSRVLAAPGTPAHSASR
jgi:hypothetical protein